MGSCISVGIYDTKSRRGYMIHRSNADCSDDIENYLDKILAKSNISNLKVYAAGGGIDSHEEEDNPHNINDEIAACRTHVADLIANRFPRSQYEINWNDSSRGVELFLDTGTGKFWIEYESFDNSDTDID